MERKLFHKISYGLYVIGSKDGDRINAQTANSVMQITSEPVTVAVSLNKNNLTNEFIRASNVLSVSILADSAQLSLVGNFGFKSGREVDKFVSVQYKKGVTGSPILLEQSVGYLEAEVQKSIDIGTHTIFIGRVVEAELFNQSEPMTYAFYQQLKSGAVSPVAAPAAVAAATAKAAATAAANVVNATANAANQAQDKTQKREGEKNMKKYECTVCGYIYDPATGDPDSGIAAGTAFEDIPDSWVCPVCGVGKDSFEEME